MRTLIFTNIEKNILLRLHGDIVSELLTDRIRIWTSGDNVNSKCDYLQSQTIRCEMSKLHSKFYFIHDSKKSQDCMAKSPNPKSTPKFPRSWGKSQAVWALVIVDLIAVELRREWWVCVCLLSWDVSTWPTLWSSGWPATTTWSRVMEPIAANTSTSTTSPLISSRTTSPEWRSGQSTTTNRCYCRTCEFFQSKIGLHFGQVLFLK